MKSFSPSYSKELHHDYRLPYNLILITCSANAHNTSSSSSKVSIVIGQLETHDNHTDQLTDYFYLLKTGGVHFEFVHPPMLELLSIISWLNSVLTVKINKYLQPHPLNTYWWLIKALMPWLVLKHILQPVPVLSQTVLFTYLYIIVS